MVGLDNADSGFEGEVAEGGSGDDVCGVGNDDGGAADDGDDDGVDGVDDDDSDEVGGCW